MSVITKARPAETSAPKSEPKAAPAAESSQQQNLSGETDSIQISDEARESGSDHRSETTYEFKEPATLEDTEGTVWEDTSLAGAVEDGELDLSQVTPEMIDELTPEQRRELAEQLKAQDIEFVSRNEDYGWGKHEEPADLALARALLNQEGGDVAAAQLFAANPQMLEDFLGSGQAVAPGVNADLVNAIADNLDVVVDDMRATQADGSPWETQELEGLGTLMALDMEASQYYYDEHGFLHKDDPDYEESLATAERFLEHLDPQNDQEIGAFNGVTVNGLFKFFDETGMNGREKGDFVNLLSSAAAIYHPGAAFAITAMDAALNRDGEVGDPTLFLGRVRAEILRDWAVEGNLSYEERAERETWFEIGLGQYAFGYE